MRILITELIWNEGIEGLVKQGYEVDYQENLWEQRDKLHQMMKPFMQLLSRIRRK